METIAQSKPALVTIAVDLPKPLVHQLRIEAARREQKIKDLVADAIAAHLGPINPAICAERPSHD